MIVFTDATYHREMSVSGAEGGGVKDVANQIMAQKIVLILYAPDHECYDELSQIDRADWQPISGPDFVQGLATYTGNAANFQKAMMALAKTAVWQAPRCLSCSNLWHRAEGSWLAFSRPAT